MKLSLSLVIDLLVLLALAWVVLSGNLFNALRILW